MVRVITAGAESFTGRVQKRHVKYAVRLVKGKDTDVGASEFRPRPGAALKLAASRICWEAFGDKSEQALDIEISGYSCWNP